MLIALKRVTVVQIIERRFVLGAQHAFDPQRIELPVDGQCAAFAIDPEVMKSDCMTFRKMPLTVDNRNRSLIIQAERPLAVNKDRQLVVDTQPVTRVEPE